MFSAFPHNQFLKAYVSLKAQLFTGFFELEGLTVSIRPPRRQKGLGNWDVVYYKSSHRITIPIFNCSTHGNHIGMEIFIPNRQENFYMQK